MTPLTGHVTTAAKNRFGWTAHAVEKSDGARDALRERDALTDRDAATPPLLEREALLDRDGATPPLRERDALTDRDKTTRLREALTDRDTDGERVAVLVGLGVRDAILLALRDTEEPNDMLRDAVGDLLALRDLLAATLALREAERVRDGDRVGVTIVHCT